MTVTIPSNKVQEWTHPFIAGKIREAIRGTEKGSDKLNCFSVSDNFKTLLEHNLRNALDKHFSGVESTTPEGTAAPAAAAAASSSSAAAAAATAVASSSSSSAAAPAATSSSVPSGTFELRVQLAKIIVLRKDTGEGGAHVAVLVEFAKSSRKGRLNLLKRNKERMDRSWIADLTHGQFRIPKEAQYATMSYQAGNADFKSAVAVRELLLEGTSFHDVVGKWMSALKEHLYVQKCSGGICGENMDSIGGMK